MIKRHRKTRETDVELALALGTQDSDTKDTKGAKDAKDTKGAKINSGIPFFDHLLSAFAFHGNMRLTLQARGDLAVDHHHTIEDIGLVLGDAIGELYSNLPPIARFGHAIVPMDDALAEVTLDLCNRPYCVYQPILPQARILKFDTALIKEFFVALSGRAHITLHLTIRYAENSHHALEALFKAFGIALWRACQPHPNIRTGAASTKGVL